MALRAEGCSVVSYPVVSGPALGARRARHVRSGPAEYLRTNVKVELLTRIPAVEEFVRHLEQCSLAKTALALSINSTFLFLLTEVAPTKIT